MIIAGGVYREECLSPAWSRIFGSGGRAAAAVSLQSANCVLHTYASRIWADDLRASMSAFGVGIQVVEIDNDIGFSYFHPLSASVRHPSLTSRYPSLRAKGDAVLRFGFVEGDAIVDGERVVYDPQNWRDALVFSDNGSAARELAIVLNESELKLSTDQDDEARAVDHLRQHTGATTIVVKRGPRGVMVYERASVHSVPAYFADAIFKIGSGDVFSAVFALEWGEKRSSAVESATKASRAVSHYVSSRSAQLPAVLVEAFRPAPTSDQIGLIYLAAPFFNLGQRWVVEESLRALEALGAPVFSPLHEVGTGHGMVDIARRDLEGLERSKAVLAIVDREDAGTLFEVGYARARGIPVVVLAETPRHEDLTMLVGSGCTVFDDFTTAIYHAIWAGMK